MNDVDMLEQLDAYGHLTWTLGDDNWFACFDAQRFGDKIAYHVVVNCESGGFIDTIEKGVISVADAVQLDGLPGRYVDAAFENHLICRKLREPVGRFAYRDCEKRWRKHIKELVRT